MSKMHNPPHPGEVLRDSVLAELSVSEFARRLGVSRVTLSRVVNGRAAVSAEMAIRLAARTRDEIEAAAAEIRAAGGSAHAVVCDVTNSGQLRKAIAALPVLDVFVNNAGSNIPEPFVEVSEEHLDRLLNLNVRAAFLAAQAAAKKMLETPERKTRGGAIVNMSSQMG